MDINKQINAASHRAGSKGLAGKAAPFCVMAGLILLPGSIAAGEVNLSPQGFKDQYRIGVKKLKEFYNKIHGTAVYSFDLHRKNKREVADEEFAVDADSFRLVMDRKEDSISSKSRKGRVSAVVDSPKRYFMVHRDPGMSEFRLDQYGTKLSPNPFNPVRDMLDREMELLRSPYGLDVYLLDLFIQPPCVIKQVVPTDVGGTSGLRVEFDADFSEQDNPALNNPMLTKARVHYSGWFTVAPDRAWAVLASKYTVTFDQNGRNSTVIEEYGIQYDGEEKGIPLLKEVVKTTTRNSKFESTKRFHVNELHHESSPKELFATRSFGIVMPDEEEERSRSFLFWTAFVAISACLLVVVLIRVRRRSAA